MNAKALWFLLGTGAGVYTSMRARRVTYRLTPSGLADQAAALGVGLQAFTDEIRVGMAEREAQISDEVGLSALGPARQTGDTTPMLEQRGTP